MCGRFALGTTDLTTHYGLQQKFDFPPRYNVAPGSRVPVVVLENGVKVMRMMRWGFELTDREGKLRQIINARGETLGLKPMFKGPFQFNRCLIPATGFYEWEKTADAKIPHYFYLKGQKMFSFGGLYRREKTGDGVILSCVIITTEPNELMAPVHNRMPLIIPRSLEDDWLRSTDPQELQNLILPYPALHMHEHTVSREVNYPGNDDPKLIRQFSWDINQEN